MYEIFKIFHDIGILMSVGAIAIETVFVWYKRFFPNTKIQFPFKRISQSVQAGLVILIISGFAMYSQKAEIFNSSMVFWVKMAFVAALIANNIWLNSFLKPKSRRMSADLAFASSPEAQKLKRRFKIAETLSLFLWITTTLVSFLLPENE